MKTIKITLGVVVFLVIIFVIAYVLHSEGLVTLTDIDNLLQRAIQTVKDWWNEMTTDPAVVIGVIRS